MPLSNGLAFAPDLLQYVKCRDMRSLFGRRRTRSHRASLTLRTQWLTNNLTV
ncbi:MAG TPA: hypothetical protein V6D43_07490 [Candidatus Sericytochromatia bacterium]